jgi:hypothetical protein
MKLMENGVALTKRDLLVRCNQMEKALGAQAQRADAAERANSALITEVVRLRAIVGEAHPPGHCIAGPPAGLHLLIG